MLLGVDPYEQLALGDWQGGDDKLQKADLSAMPARYSASRYKFSVRVKLTVIHVFKSLWLRFEPQTWDAIPERAFALAKEENEDAIASGVDADSRTVWTSPDEWSARKARRFQFRKVALPIRQSLPSYLARS